MTDGSTAETGRTGEQVDSPTTTETTQTDGSTGTEGEGAAAEPKTTETKPAEHMIPKSRLDEVIGQRKEAQAELEAALARVKELEAGADTKTEPAETDDPETKAAEQFVMKTFDKAVQNRWGMSTDQVKAVLDAATVTAKESTDSKWQRLCSEHKLDPRSQDVQTTVSGLVHSLKSYENADLGRKMTQDEAVAEAFKRTAKLYADHSSDGSETKTASVESSTVSGTMAKGRMIPKNKQEALEMAKKGQQATYQSSQEIIGEALGDDKGPQVRQVN